MSTKTHHLQIIDAFFRGTELKGKYVELENMRDNFNQAIEDAEKNGGCSKCQRNAIRRRFRKLIIQFLEVVDEAEAASE